MALAYNDIRTVDDENFSYIYQQNVSVPLRTAAHEASGGTVIRCNVYRPKSALQYPVLVTYGPYGKDIHYKEYESQLSLFVLAH